MITFTLIHRSKTKQEYDEFLKSLSYSNSGENSFEVISDQDSKMFEDGNIHRVSEPSADSKIHITLSDDCLVLGNAWDKYIKHALDNGLPQYGVGRDYVPEWTGFVQRKMGLQTRRPPEGLFPDLKVILATQ